MQFFCIQLSVMFSSHTQAFVYIRTSFLFMVVDAFIYLASSEGLVIHLIDSSWKE